MNLRYVHAALILLSAALAVLFGLWCLRAYNQEGSTAGLIGAIVAFGVSIGLVFYDRWFLRKTRALQ